MREAKEVLLLQTLQDHGKKKSFIYIVHIAVDTHTHCHMLVQLIGKKGREREEKTRRNKILKIAFFLGHTLKKPQHIHYLVHGRFSWSTFGLHLVKSPKAL